MGLLWRSNQNRPSYDNRLRSAEKVAQPLLKASAGSAVGNTVFPEEDSAGYIEHMLVPWTSALIPVERWTMRENVHNSSRSL